MQDLVEGPPLKVKRMAFLDEQWGSIFLQPIWSGEVQGSPRFVLQDRLRSDASASAEIQIVEGPEEYSEEFWSHFSGLIEEDVPDASLRLYWTNEHVLHPQTIETFGEKAEIKFAHFFELHRKQSRGQNGPLSIEGPNYAYVRNARGELMVAQSNWHQKNQWNKETGWTFSARPPDPWVGVSHCKFVSLC